MRIAGADHEAPSLAALNLDHFDVPAFSLDKQVTRAAAGLHVDSEVCKPCQNSQDPKTDFCFLGALQSFRPLGR